jgi:hypothetical protein
MLAPYVPVLRDGLLLLVNDIQAYRQRRHSLYLPLDQQLANDFFAQAVVVTKDFQVRSGVQQRILATRRPTARDARRPHVCLDDFNCPFRLPGIHECCRNASETIVAWVVDLADGELVR